MVEGDFFNYDWHGEKGIQSKGGFDLIYDYTVGSVDGKNLTKPFRNPTPGGTISFISIAKHILITVPLRTSSNSPLSVGSQNGRTCSATAWTPCVCRVSALQTP